MKMRVPGFALLICTLFPFAAKGAGILGSSVLISRDGHLITGEHVIAGCASLNAVGIGPVIAVGHDAPRFETFATISAISRHRAEPEIGSVPPTPKRCGKDIY